MSDKILDTGKQQDFQPKQQSDSSGALAYRKAQIAEQNILLLKLGRFDEVDVSIYDDSSILDNCLHYNGIDGQDRLNILQRYFNYKNSKNNGN